jgi:8-oxo-dGTP pyrophosphatase MutT (NUDIX family)
VTNWGDDVPGAIVRPTVRVLLIDDLERVLLFRGDGEDGLPFWFPAGGGVEDGETHEAAGVRELAEETGLRVDHPGDLIGHRRHVITMTVWDGRLYDVRERWYLHRCTAFDIDTSGFTELERETMTVHRWFSRDDLRSSSDRLVPRDLADLVERLLSDGVAEEPETIGI